MSFSPPHFPPVKRSPFFSLPRDPLHFPPFLSSLSPHERSYCPFPLISLPSNASYLLPLSFSFPETLCTSLPFFPLSRHTNAHTFPFPPLRTVLMTTGLPWIFMSVSYPSLSVCIFSYFYCFLLRSFSALLFSSSPFSFSLLHLPSVLFLAFLLSFLDLLSLFLFLSLWLSLRTPVLLFLILLSFSVYLIFFPVFIVFFF